MNRPRWLDPAIAGFMDLMAILYFGALIIGLLFAALYGVAALVTRWWGAA